MSIVDKINSLEESRNIIRSKMIEAGQATSNDKLSTLASNLVIGSGHTIEDPEGTALTQRDVLQFGGDLEVSDDSGNEATVVTPHELTAAELAEIVTPLPSVPVNMPILFDETRTERVVGWYKLANGTKKPVYEKSFSVDTVVSNNDINVGLISSNIDTVCYIGGTIKYTTGIQAVLNRIGTNTQDAFVDSGKLIIRNKNYAGKNEYNHPLH